MSTKVQRCTRCDRRWRGQDNWNGDYVAGIEIGVYCPDCQTAAEDIEAQVNLVLRPPSQSKAIKLSTHEDVEHFITQLIAQYSTPQIMRRKADLLDAARPDKAEMVRLMRRIAADMESGELYEDD